MTRRPHIPKSIRLEAELSGRLAIALKGAYLWHNAALNIRGAGGWCWPAGICVPRPGTIGPGEQLSHPEN